jgi:uncharacterized membrane protein YphA (DoxX/SURF4 family)
MRTNPFYDAWLFVIGATEDHAKSGIGYLLALLFLVLLAASIIIAWRNWRDDQAQRKWEHVATWFMRVMIGSMWFQASLWKLPLPVSGGFQYWTEQLSRYAAFGWHRSLVTEVFLPLIKVIDPLVYLTELSLAISFLLGFLVRPAAIIGMLFVLHIWLGLYHHPTEWPWLYIFLVFVQGFFVVTNAGQSLGLDALLSRERIGPFAGDGWIAWLYRRLA